VRGGDVVAELNGARQECTWPEGQYFNAGPARISSQHFRVLDYCRRLSVPLEVQVTTNRAARYHDDEAFGGKAIENRQLHYDTRGYISELLGKCIRQGALDEELSAEDRRRLVEFLQDFGDLTTSGEYAGSSRAGYSRMPGGGTDFGKARKPLAFKDLLDARFWTWMFNEDEVFGHQATLFQPVGGMDRIVGGFRRKLEPGTVQSNCIVTEIENGEDSVGIVYRKTKAGSLPVFPKPHEHLPHRFGFSDLGERAMLKADFCITTIPFAGYKYIRTNFSPRKAAAILTGQHYENSVKTGWLSRRWWEEDLGIYGGVTYTTRDIEQIWYPSNGFFEPLGIILTSYNDGASAHEWHKLPPAERAELARKSTDRVHPGYGKELKDPIAHSWRNVPFAWGAWPAWEPDDSPGVTAFFADIVRSEGRVHFGGDIASLWAGWMEGAFAAAHKALHEIDERVHKA
jgi:monoamine oxidase